MRAKRSKQIRKLAAILCPTTPRWAARWLRRHGAGKVGELQLPATPAVTRYGARMRLAHKPQPVGDERKGSYKRLVKVET